jgi:flavorubredoxin
MHEPVAITDGIFWIGVDDRETALFEALWPLPEGVSYNAYMIKDEKIALIDTVKRGFLDDYLDKVSRSASTSRFPHRTLKYLGALSGSLHTRHG